MRLAATDPRSSWGAQGATRGSRTAVRKGFVGHQGTPEGDSAFWRSLDG